MLIREELRGGHGAVADGYAAFCESLDKRPAGIAADEMEDRPGDDDLADAAIHFALISYAAGVASSRYVALLRAKGSSGGKRPPAARKRPKKERRD